MAISAIINMPDVVLANRAYIHSEDIAVRPQANSRSHNVMAHNASTCLTLQPTEFEPVQFDTDATYTRQVKGNDGLWWKSILDTGQIDAGLWGAWSDLIPHIASIKMQAVLYEPSVDSAWDYDPQTVVYIGGITSCEIDGNTVYVPTEGTIAFSFYEQQELLEIWHVSNVQFVYDGENIVSYSYDRRLIESIPWPWSWPMDLNIEMYPVHLEQTPLILGGGILETLDQQGSGPISKRLVKYSCIINDMPFDIPCYGKSIDSTYRVAIVRSFGAADFRLFKLVFPPGEDDLGNPLVSGYISTRWVKTPDYYTPFTVMKSIKIGPGSIFTNIESATYDGGEYYRGTLYLYRDMDGPYAKYTTPVVYSCKLDTVIQPAQQASGTELDLTPYIIEMNRNASIRESGTLDLTLIEPEEASGYPIYLAIQGADQRIDITVDGSDFFTGYIDSVGVGYEVMRGERKCLNYKIHCRDCWKRLEKAFFYADYDFANMMLSQAITEACKRGAIFTDLGQPDVHFGTGFVDIWLGYGHSKKLDFKAKTGTKISEFITDLCSKVTGEYLDYVFDWSGGFWIFRHPFGLYEGITAKRTFYATMDLAVADGSNDWVRDIARDTNDDELYNEIILLASDPAGMGKIKARYADLKSVYDNTYTYYVGRWRSYISDLGGYCSVALLNWLCYQIAKRHSRFKFEFKFASSYYPDLYPGDVISIADVGTTYYYRINSIQTIINKSLPWEDVNEHYELQSVYTTEQLL